MSPTAARLAIRRRIRKVHTNGYKSVPPRRHRAARATRLPTDNAEKQRNNTPQPPGCGGPARCASPRQVDNKESLNDPIQPCHPAGLRHRTRFDARRVRRQPAACAALRPESA
ncbi:hypothetical protein PSP6_150045 [Paraburkholderia tropica]|nr:hypothetical protein PSP6_150045 [Paraburkholderia tropica]